jgi:3-oxoacyl-[acyl-carrier-protein] synthase-1
MLYIHAFSATASCGKGCRELRQALLEDRPGLTPWAGPLSTHVGAVSGLDEIRLPERLRHFDCRNNRLAEMALRLDQFEAAVQATAGRFGASRIGLIVGTSSSGIATLEETYSRKRNEPCDPADRLGDTFELHATTRYLGQRLPIAGPAITVSSACSSSAQSLALAHQWLEQKWIDAAVVAGIDSLCMTTLFGFRALNLITPTVCRPFDRARAGINLGEAAALMLVSGQPAPWRLAGYGESSDAYHITAPHPDGEGAWLAMSRALAMAGIRPTDIGYIHAHGTGTRLNDASEDRAISRLFPRETPVSSTKGWTGHTLGAAGMMGALFSLLTLDSGFLPRTLNTQECDPSLRSRILLHHEHAHPHYVLSNAFGFGGNNCALIFSGA